MKTIYYVLLLAVVVNGACTPKQKQETKAPVVEQAVTRQAAFKVGGMTCDHCEMSIRKGVEELNGIITVEANYEDSTTHVTFDPSRTGEEEIIAAIEKRGYEVIRDN